MANKYQIQMLHSYPGANSLGLALDDPDSVERAVNEGTTGDGLFDFLWFELADVEDAGEAEVRMRSAFEDISAVMYSFSDDD